LTFLKGAYQDGIRAFQLTELHNHYMWLMRVVVHDGHENRPGCAGRLKEVAEAFMDCQTIQARVVEKVGLEIKGVALDFRGLAVKLVGDYKGTAIRMLAEEEMARAGGPDLYFDPNHYENRLAVDLGEQLGLNEADVRRAEHDTHAEARFQKLDDDEQPKFVDRAREMFDVDATLKAFAAEASSFSEHSPPDSMAALFLKWVSEHMTEKHLVFSDDSCTSVEVSDSLALAVFEVLFLGATTSQERHRGAKLCDLFVEATNHAIGVARLEACEEKNDVDPVERLVLHLTSPAVRLPAPCESDEVPLEMTAEEVAAVFVRHVPGVETFLYRDQPGVYALKFVQGGYREGLRAFHGTELHNHFMWLLRLIVHYGRDEKPECARHLKEVAEAFMDCQAVQARVVERVGFEIRGLALDFKGLVVKLVGDYKATAIRMLAEEEVRRLGGPDEFFDPNHYDNRIIIDLGEAMGLNEADVRRAKKDEHALQRFKPVPAKRLEALLKRARALFDFDAMVKAFVAEVNNFSEQSSSESMSRLFLGWVAEHMSQKHVVFRDESCTHVEVGDALAVAVLEVLFMGATESKEEYRGETMASLFLAPTPLALGNNLE